jgi:hypothetical protein
MGEVVPEPVREHPDAALALRRGDDLVDPAGGHRLPVADAEPQPQRWAWSCRALPFL